MNTVVHRQFADKRPDDGAASAIGDKNASMCDFGQPCDGDIVTNAQQCGTADGWPRGSAADRDT